MHTHEHEPDPLASPHLSVSREVDQADPEMVQAAVAGRTDAISSRTVRNLQRLAGNSSVGSMLSEKEESPVRDVVRSDDGEPLDSKTRGDMESRLGEDLSDVRVHTGGKADASARSINAQAYTVGNDVVFGGGKYQPNTPTGQRVIAHELAHVVQQRSGPVDGTEAPGGIKVSDPSDRFEQAAEQTADRAMSDPSAPLSAEAASPSSASVQREAKPGEEEEEVQSLAAQRAAAGGEEDKEEEVQSLAAQREAAAGEEEKEDESKAV
jgi:uncharacterized protein DUF4157